jgi:hypothetical protein
MMLIPAQHSSSGSYLRSKERAAGGKPKKSVDGEGAGGSQASAGGDDADSDVHESDLDSLDDE